MHYYQFNIGDYHSHTSHLDEMEDLAYRRMIDYCYLNEIGLPKSVEEIARLIRMRTHCESIANVLREFFVLKKSTYLCKRVEKDLEIFKEKSNKAKASANARWAKTKDLADANALRTECEGNANHKPITNNHKPLTNRARFTPPKVEEVEDYVKTRPVKIDSNTFVDFYQGKGWMIGKNKMKDWQAAVRTWEKNQTPESGNSQDRRVGI